MDRRKLKILVWCLLVALVLCLVAAFCVEYFVLQNPLFDRSGWYTTEAGQVQYRDYYAKPLTGLQTIENKQYYFADDGSRYTGWLDTDAGRCYFGADGALCTGWLDVDG